MAQPKNSESLVSGIVKGIYSGISKFAFKKRPTRIKEREQLFQINEFLVNEKLHELEAILGIKIQKPQYFEQALTHRSYLQVKQNPIRRSNERLEFLGDSILGMIVAENLFDQYAEVQEGELTKMRSWLVNKKSLAICARKLKLDSFMLISYSAEQSLHKGSDAMIADALEAIIAAIYLEAGLEATRHFIEDVLLPIMVSESLMKDTNFKSLLLEHVQGYGKPAPRYNVVEEKGPDHDKDFTIAVYVGDEFLSTGIGKSKKDAEQNAAQQALRQFFKILQ